MKLSDVLSVSLEDRKGYLTLIIFCPKVGRLVIRKTEGIREWHDCLKTLIFQCPERKTEDIGKIMNKMVKTKENGIVGENELF